MTDIDKLSKKKANNRRKIVLTDKSSDKVVTKAITSVRIHQTSVRQD